LYFRKMIKRFVLLSIIILSPYLLAQSTSEAESLFNSRQYLKAKVVYETLLKKKPNDALYNYRMARCCYELKYYESAIQHFEL